MILVYEHRVFNVTFTIIRRISQDTPLFYFDTIEYSMKPDIFMTILHHFFSSVVAFQFIVLCSMSKIMCICKKFNNFVQVNS